MRQAVQTAGGAVFKDPALEANFDPGVGNKPKHRQDQQPALAARETTGTYLVRILGTRAQQDGDGNRGYGRGDDEIPSTNPVGPRQRSADNDRSKNAADAKGEVERVHDGATLVHPQHDRVPGDINHGSPDTQE